jgi:hypothetical protein
MSVRCETSCLLSVDNVEGTLKGSATLSLPQRRRFPATRSRRKNRGKAHRHESVGLACTEPELAA